ncbi:glycosyl transferase family 2 [Paenibacillus selenitireducens]|uniref:Glycosyl transferase family 2 n=1 Tax=Paenibacillus selenitireducens TaxID=1324314 RepID=A0A1T2XJW2_9BACL|nr:glycosyltransferase family 2 protein [Paenibacillus selenitireducens]OPA80159.1 glycosyl transferase family 2 [Paenibacillus selenitireducens]
MTFTSIIIPTYNGLHYLQSCVNSIRQYTNVPYELIVVDNASTDGTVEYCRREAITFISLPTNVGFPKACNEGLRAAKGDHLLLLNNDVIVTHHWLSNMTNALSQFKHVGIVGPKTNYASGRQKVTYPYDNFDELHRLTQEINQQNASKWKDVERLVGFCFLFKREVMERIGYLDEQFSPGHYEDDDYCYRARMHGYHLLICGDTYVHHHGGISFLKHESTELNKLIDRNYHLFRQKWNVDPHIFI